MLARRLATITTCVALAIVSYSPVNALGFDNLNTTAAVAAAESESRASTAKFRWTLNAATERTFDGSSKDPGDPLASSRGSATMSISKDGILSVSGNTPRYYVTAPTPVLRNVEMTAYGRLVKKMSEMKDYAGMTMVTRSNHGQYREDPCQALGYYNRIFFNTGEVAFQKEFYHNLEKSKTVYTVSRRQPLFKGGFPLNKWIGMKYQVRTSDDGKSVRLRTYIDENESGEWKLVFETTDEGGWKAQTTVPSECGVKQDEIVLRPGSDSYFRTDTVDEFQWKKMKIRVL